MNEQGVTWADVESAKDALNRGRMPLLREQWKALSRVPIPDYKRVEFEAADHPLRVLFRSLVHGRYPPPELLVAMQRAFQAYLDARGQMTLEEAFFGPAVKRAGTYAERSAKAERDFRGALLNPRRPLKPHAKKGASDPAQRAEGMPITRKALDRIVSKNPRLKRFATVEPLPPDSTSTPNRCGRTKSSAK